MNVWDVMIIVLFASTAIICLGFMVHLLVVQEKGFKLKAWITKELNELNDQVWKRVFENHTLNVMKHMETRDPQHVVHRLLEFYNNKDLIFYFNQMKDIGTDEDIIMGLEYLEQETVAYYQQHEKMISIDEMAKKYWKWRHEKHALNDDIGV